MTTCASRKGFLTLTDCGSPVSRNCSHCSRPMCSQHLAPQSGFSMCFDCAAQQPVPSAEGQKPGATKPDGEYDDTWAHGYRRSYYAATGFVPMAYAGTRVHSYYDSRDSSAFDESYTGDDETLGGGGFGDS